MICRRIRPAFAAVLGLAVFAMGCGGTGETGAKRARVTGSVTFMGKPLASGTIDFEPDAAAGNKGPGTTAGIEDGRFSASLVPGKNVVRVSPPAAVSGGGAPVVNFQPYETKHDVPSGSSTFDVDLPATE